MFTRTPWYVVPLIWVPITLYILYLSVSQQLDKGTEWGTAWGRTGACFLLGNFIWTVSWASYPLLLRNEDRA